VNRIKFFHSEQGQSLILIAAVMVSLLAMAGLAIDGGNFFLQRRNTQNAADAIALAGTRVLAQAICGEPDVTDATVSDAVNRYAQLNGIKELSSLTVSYVSADEAVLGVVGGGSVPTGAIGVSVKAANPIPTYFLPVVGINSFTASASAMAMSGKVVQLSGVLPIGVPLDVVLALDPGEPFVMMENNQHNGGSFCVDENGNAQYDSGEECIGDPASHNSHRGWLNLNYIYNQAYVKQDASFYRTFEQNVSNRGCGKDPGASIDDGLQGWAGDDCPYPFPIFAGTPGATDGDFIHGDPGARQSSLMEVIQTYNGQTAYVPIFDVIYLSDYMADYFPQPEGIGWPRAGGGGHAFLYHIVGFALIKIDDPNLHDHDLAAEFRSATIGGGAIQLGAGFGSDACPGGMLYGINLWQ
jgi:Flp pilus assembly protein TadG